jgi:glycerophosphoryl diester phosphodiesterase
MMKLAPAVAILSLFACAPDASDGAPEPENSQDASGAWSVSPSEDLNAFFDCLEEKKMTLVSAHRGGAAPGFPENSIEAIHYTLSQIPSLVEVDVATSADGVLYLMHDDTLDRTTTGIGPANERPWSYISGLNLIDEDGRETPFNPPRFSDALSAAKDRTIIQIDFKRSTRYEKVIEEVNRQGADDRVIYIAYSLAAAEKLHRLAPNSMISLNISSQSELNSAVAAGVPDNRLLGFTGIEEPNARLAAQLNARDVEVIFGTLGGRNSIDEQIRRSGGEESYAELAEIGIDIIATDRPVQAHKALEAGGRAATNGACGVTR